MTYDQFLRELENVDMSSSPGYPLMLRYSVNRDFLKNADDSWNMKNVRSLWENVRRSLVDKLSDPIRVFVKKEPHKMSKIDSSRYRLIYSVSLVDTMIDRMLFGDFSRKLLENWLSTPSMIGWSPYRGGWKLLPHKAVGYDFSAWEYTVRDWLISDFKTVLMDLCYEDVQTPYGSWKDLVEFRFRQLFSESILHFSNGRRLKQKIPGLMKSGTFLTIIGNTVMQVLLYLTACYQAGETPGEILAMGDDSLYRRKLSPLVLFLYKIWGFVVKGFAENEFCGTTWNSGFVEPVYRGKHLARLARLTDDLAKETLQSYQVVYGASKWLGRLRDIISRTYPHALLPVRLITDIYNGFT
uniref:RdRp catalytic domain-containing protein n=1 Tax=Sanxia water strider virus 11 TaxID=1923395 RepID=A0A1L3KER5_9VIRU|nr:hypothetical protein 2 [Sanxia water strider virus 11]